MSATAQSNFRYVSGALVLHALIAGFIAAAMLYSPRIVVQEMGIKAMLVDSNSLNPPKPQMDPQEQERLEQQKQEQQRQEQERVEQLRQQQQAQQLRVEQQEKAKQAEQKHAADVQQAKRQAEQQRVAEIKQKQRDVEQKRHADAEAKSQAAREAELKEQLAAEEGRNHAIDNGELAKYKMRIAGSIYRHWFKPLSAKQGVDCQVSVHQARGGMVISVRIGACNGDEAVKQSIQAAVYAASPLPAPDDPRVFDPDLTFNFRPTE